MVSWWKGWRELLGYDSEHAIAVTGDLRELIVMNDSIRYVNWVFSDSWVSMCIGFNETEGMVIRDTRFLFW